MAANVFKETRTAFAYFRCCFFNDSTFNESRTSAFSPKETNRVPVAKQNAIPVIAKTRAYY